MIVGAVILIAPLLLIYVLHKYAKLRNKMTQIKANSVSKIEFDKMKEERDMFLNDYLKELDKRDVKNVTEPIEKFNLNNLSYQELEDCTNYFVENQHKLKNQHK
jgi:hypothetical protein